MDDSNKETWHEHEWGWFEYRRPESDESGDAELWHHSHQRALILGEDEYDGWPGSTFDKRAEAGLPKVYRVQFEDGFVYSAFEDELLTDPSGFCRPDPPGAPDTTPTIV